jgi:hypothetical protein
LVQTSIFLDVASIQKGQFPAKLRDIFLTERYQNPQAIRDLSRQLIVRGDLLSNT